MIENPDIDKLATCSYYGLLVDKVLLLHKEKVGQRLTDSELSKYKRLLVLINKTCASIIVSRHSDVLINKDDLEIIEKSLIVAKLIQTDGGAVRKDDLIQSLWIIISCTTEVYVTKKLTEQSVRILNPFLNGISEVTTSTHRKIMAVT